MDFLKMLKSFNYAFKGLYSLIRSENNFKFHFASAFAVILLSIFLDLDSLEWLFIFLAITLVFVSEAFNTSIEGICDEISPNYNKSIGKIKDIAAAGVLIAAFFALSIFCVLLLPKVYSLILEVI